MNLLTYRNEIDALDKQIIALLEQRFAVVEQIGKYKQKADLGVQDLKREQAVLEGIAMVVHNRQLVHSIQHIYEQILAESRVWEY